MAVALAELKLPERTHHNEPQLFQGTDDDDRTVQGKVTLLHPADDAHAVDAGA